MRSAVQGSWSRWLLGCAAAMLMLAPVAAETTTEDVILVANGSVSDSSITRQLAQDMFLGKKVTWSDGTAIVLATLSDGETHDKFLRAVVGRTASQFSTYWKKLAFSGKAMEPKSFDTEEKLLKFVGENKGAVGYVSAKTAANKDAMAGCKILSADVKNQEGK